MDLHQKPVTLQLPFHIATRRFAEGSRRVTASCRMSHIITSQNICPTLLCLLDHILSLYLQNPLLAKVIDLESAGRSIRSYPGCHTVALETIEFFRAELIDLVSFLGGIDDVVLVEACEECISTVPALLPARPIHLFVLVEKLRGHALRLQKLLARLA